MTKQEFNQMWYELYTKIWGPSAKNIFDQTTSNTMAGIVKKYLYPPGKVKLSGNIQVDEDAVTATIFVERYEGSSGSVSINYSTQNGTALAGTDYVAKTGTINWADGEMGQKGITISIIDDLVYEDNEIRNFSVNLSAPTGGLTLGTPTSTVVGIRDNEIYIPPSEDLPPPNNNDFIQTPHDNIPNFGKNPNIWSIKSGNWSDPTLWNLGRVPVQSDIVSITGTTNVVYDILSQQKIKCLTVQDSGYLKFIESLNTKLYTTHMMVLAGGRLDIGTDESPVQTGINCDIIFCDTPINTVIDPSQYGNGLLVFGKWNVCGCGTGIPKTFIRLTENALVGQNTLKLSLPAEGWNIGDEIFIPDTHQLNYFEKAPTWNFTAQNERFLITNISADKLTLTLNGSLAFNHKGHLENNQPTILPHVGLLSRNVIISSENPNGVRGHILATMSADVDVCHAQFKDLGRTTNEELNSTTFNANGAVNTIGTNQIGRYPLHVHHVHGSMQGNMEYRFMIDGISVIGSPKWGITIHGSHYGKVSNSIVYDVKGSGFAFEDGSESFNLIEANFVCKVWGTGINENSGRDGVGFWFHGPNNYVRDNVAANCYPGQYCYGFSITPRYLGNINVPVSIDSMNTVSINSNAIALPDFSNNEVYASCNGITCWWLGTIEDNPIAGAIAGEIKNLKVWHCFNGAYFGYATQGLTIDGWWVRGDTTNISQENRINAAIYFSDYYQKDLVIKNCNIAGVNIGIDTPITGTGTTLIDSCVFRAMIGIFSQNFWAVSGGQNAKPRHLQINNCVFLPDVTSIYIKKGYYVGGQRNGIAKNSIQVLNLNNLGENFNVFVPEQLPDAIVPVNGANPETGGWPFVGAPEAGLTNTQCLATYGICVNDEIAPADCETVPYIQGIIKRF